MIGNSSCSSGTHSHRFSSIELIISTELRLSPIAGIVILSSGEEEVYYTQLTKKQILLIVTIKTLFPDTRA
jgi:hypothetical protein